MLEPQTDGDSVDQPASAKSICKPMSKAKPIRKILVPGSSHDRRIGHSLQNAMGDACAVTSSYSFLISALDGREWSASRPIRALAPRKGPPVPIVQESGWAPEPV
jgi:hypothetical protein